MASMRQGWGIQVRVIHALIIRELITRFGRENIGFLWIMVEPLLFALLVGLLWRGMKGPLEFGLDIVAFVVTGYIPLVLFRSSIGRAVNAFTANGSFLYHRQIKILDLILVRFIVELIGHMMAYLFMALVLGALGFFPWPYDLGFLILGWFYYALFTLAVTLVIAPLSEMSEVLEKVIPVTVYMMIPFSGAFYLVSSLVPAAAEVVLYSPPVHAMEMMRYGVFGPSIDPQYDFSYPLAFSLPCLALGLLLCRKVRRRLVVE
ncbi:ABC transporter permease [Sphingorhabdus sp.]|jgi:capsular polysaccharide transport system permease protein|uniref:ABC transporter permease n=1 Tax=Sphingorhabdus sp. TaxID=1902408 RepID=UPI0037C80306